MQNEVKAHAQITNEMRTYFAAEKHGVHYDCHDVAWHRLFAYWADNLDEAYERDTAALRAALAAPQAPHGDAAVMREALSDACYAMFNFLKTQSGGYEEMAIALDKAKAAIAAPPRNCDRTFADHVAMYDEFKAWCNAKGHTMNPKLASDAFDWLLSKAEGAQ
jgi:hypothetical protein